MNQKEFQTICEFVRESSGIVLNQSKEYLVVSRLKPVAEKFGFADLGALAAGLNEALPEVKNAVTDAMTTNETFFFRDKTPFTLFEQIILPELVKARRASGHLRI